MLMTDEQCAETNSLALRIGEAADNEILRQLTLHLQPLFRAAMLVDRTASLRDHAFPAVALRAFPRRRIVDQRDAPHWLFKRQLSEKLTTLLKRQCRDVATVQP